MLHSNNCPLALVDCFLFWFAREYLLWCVIADQLTYRSRESFLQLFLTLPVCYTFLSHFCYALHQVLQYKRKCTELEAEAEAEVVKKSASPVSTHSRDSPVRSPVDKQPVSNVVMVTKVIYLECCIPCVSFHFNHCISVKGQKMLLYCLTKNIGSPDVIQMFACTKIICLDCIFFCLMLAHVV